VTCDACKPMTPYSHVVKDRDKNKLKELIGPCPVCNGSPETTLTVIDIQVINNKSYITEKADKDNPYGKRVLKNKWNFEIKVLEGL